MSFAADAETWTEVLIALALSRGDSAAPENTSAFRENTSIRRLRQRMFVWELSVIDGGRPLDGIGVCEGHAAFEQSEKPS